MEPKDAELILTALFYREQRTAVSPREVEACLLVERLIIDGCEYAPVYFKSNSAILFSKNLTLWSANRFPGQVP